MEYVKINGEEYGVYISNESEYGINEDCESPHITVELAGKKCVGYCEVYEVVSDKAKNTSIFYLKHFRADNPQTERELLKQLCKDLQRTHYKNTMIISTKDFSFAEGFAYVGNIKFYYYKDKLEE